ncbi:MAG: hypothetical protein ACYDBB_04415 [Armatimonadota bacterium]
MTEPLMPLTPDDNQREHLDLLKDENAPGQPYGLVAIMAALLVMLVARGLLANMEQGRVVIIALVSAVVVYLALINLRPRLPLPVFCLFAAQLAMLLSLPVENLYVESWQSIVGIVYLVAQLFISGAIGLTLSILLPSERYPSWVITISFLTVFVSVNYYYLFM